MEPLIVVTYPEPVTLEARQIQHEAIPEGEIGVGYYYGSALIARSSMAPESLQAIHDLLEGPVNVAIAAMEDERGNIDARVCLVLPIDSTSLEAEEEDEDEPWKASIPSLPPGIESDPLDDDRQDRVVLIPIGHVVRSRDNRNHPDDLAGDAQEMLDNLLRGRSQDAVAKAIDDLLKSI